MMRQLFFISLFIVAQLVVASPGDDQCLQRVSKQYGEPCKQCPGSTDAFVIVYKNSCQEPMDVVIAIQELNKKWKYFFRAGIKPNDTIIAYSCNSNSKSQYFIRKAGASIHLPSCEEINEEYIKAGGKDACTGQVPVKLVDINAKLLHGEKKKEPLANQRLSLKDEKGQAVQTAVTDQYGDFNFKQVNPAQSLKIFLEDNPAIAKEEKIYLAKQNGFIIREVATGTGFTFELLPPDIVTLSKVEEDDPFLQMIDFKKSAQKEILITDMVYYKQESWELEPEAKRILDKVVQTLKNSPLLKVEVLSHSDARGDDASNLKLSEKRAQSAVQYIIANGIEAVRVNGKGQGETRILNRCGNGVNCSEKEHAFNRRTEFRFYK